MNVSEFTARMVLLFLPGIMCELAADALTVHHERKPLRFMIHSFVFGVLCYGGYALLWWTNSLATGLFGGFSLSWWPTEITIIEALIDTKNGINFVEVAIATGLAIPISLFFCLVHNRKWAHRVARRCGITNRFGEVDVWSFAFNMDAIEWAYVRDLKNDLVFEGWIRGFSDAEISRELLLSNVSVYKNETGEHLYDVDTMYISRKNEDWTIEFPGSMGDSSSKQPEHEKDGGKYDERQEESSKVRTEGRDDQKGRAEQTADQFAPRRTERAGSEIDCD